MGLQVRLSDKGSTAVIEQDHGTAIRKQGRRRWKCRGGGTGRRDRDLDQLRIVVDLSYDIARIGGIDRNVLEHFQRYRLGSSRGASWGIVDHRQIEGQKLAPFGNPGSQYAERVRPESRVGGPQFE